MTLLGLSEELADKADVIFRDDKKCGGAKPDMRGSGRGSDRGDDQDSP